MLYLIFSQSTEMQKFRMCTNAQMSAYTAVGISADRGVDRSFRSLEQHITSCSMQACPRPFARNPLCGSGPLPKADECVSAL